MSKVIDAITLRKNQLAADAAKAAYAARNAAANARREQSFTTNESERDALRMADFAAEAAADAAYSVSTRVLDITASYISDTVANAGFAGVSQAQVLRVVDTHISNKGE